MLFHGFYLCEEGKFRKAAETRKTIPSWESPALRASHHGNTPLLLLSAEIELLPKSSNGSRGKENQNKESSSEVLGTDESIEERLRGCVQMYMILVF